MKKLKRFFTARKIITTLLMLGSIVISIALSIFFSITNNSEGVNIAQIEIFAHAFEIVSYVFVIAGVIIGVWQYYLSSKSEMIKNDTEKVSKAIELSGFYKDNILRLFQPVRYVYEKIGALDIINGIDKSKIKNFNTHELNNLLSSEKICEMKQMFIKPEFIESVTEANYIYGLKLDLSDSCGIFNFYPKDPSSEEQPDESREIELKRKMLDITVSKIADSYMNKVVCELLNSLEYFAMYFIHNIADKTVVFQSLHQSYIEIVETLYYNIAHQNETPESKYYTNVTNLYLEWKKILVEQRKKVDKIKNSATNEMNQLPIQGTIPQNLKNS